MPYSKEEFRKPDNDGKRAGKNVFYRPMTFFLIIVAIIFVMGVFFEISVINVEGNEIYSAQEIINASGIHTGDNLFFINRIGAGSRVVVELPYVESVSITRSLPNAITVKVNESHAVAYISVGQELWTVSRSGKLLGAVKEAEPSRYPFIKGLALDNGAVGDFLTVPPEQQPTLDYLLEILYQIQARGLTDKVSEIDLSAPDDPVLEYESRFVVHFGAKDDTEYKFGKMLSAVSQLTSEDSGTMDLSDADKVNFRPN